MALRDDLRQRIADLDDAFDLSPGYAVDAILDLLRDPAHRDELLAMLLGPDESVRRDGEMRDRQGRVWRRAGVDDPTSRGRRAWLVPVSGAEPPRKVPADCPHDTFESDGGHELRRCVQCGLGGGAEREPSGEVRSTYRPPYRFDARRDHPPPDHNVGRAADLPGGRRPAVSTGDSVCRCGHQRDDHASPLLGRLRRWGRCSWGGCSCLAFDDLARSDDRSEEPR